jgi:hypothetical protein
VDVETLCRKYQALEPELTERSRRLWAASEARELGRGGIALVEGATGVSRSTIARGVRELEAGEVLEMGHEVSHMLVADLLRKLGYSLQANLKTREGPQHPDRDAQFRYVNDAVRRFQKKGQPAISVDTKKKELIGDFRNPGREWRPKGSPERVRVHDFLIPEQGKAIPLRGLRSHAQPGLGQRRCHAAART